MLSFYQFYPRQIITPDPNSAYFIRDFEAKYLSSGDIHNPEWYIQQKIKENADGYFDFSKSMIDIGACYGTYSFTLPFKHSYMFEPNKEYCAYCHANMLLQGRIYDADIFNMAVSNESGTIRFDGYNGGERASEYNAWTNTPCVDVPCVRLDDMQDRLTNIGFIKIDIEGMEPYALMGAKQVIMNNNYPPIMFESWPEGKMETPEQYNKRISLLNEVFNELGYTVIWNWCGEYGDNENHLAIHK